MQFPISLPSCNIKNRHSQIEGSQFHLKTVIPYKLFGAILLDRKNTQVAISNPTKTIIDLLDDPKLAGGHAILQSIIQCYQASDLFDQALLNAYADQMQNKAILSIFYSFFAK